jgi:hypothetical protein
LQRGRRCQDGHDPDDDHHMTDFVYLDETIHIVTMRGPISFDRSADLTKVGRPPKLFILSVSLLKYVTARPYTPNLVDRLECCYVVNQ